MSRIYAQLNHGERQLYLKDNGARLKSLITAANRFAFHDAPYRASAARKGPTGQTVVDYGNFPVVGHWQVAHDANTWIDKTGDASRGFSPYDYSLFWDESLGPVPYPDQAYETARWIGGYALDEQQGVLCRVSQTTLTKVPGAGPFGLGAIDVVTSRGTSTQTAYATSGPQHELIDAFTWRQGIGEEDPLEKLGRPDDLHIGLIMGQLATWQA